MRILAIDPGAQGGYAFKLDNPLKVSSGTGPLPDTEGDIITLIKEMGPDVAYLEDLVKYAGTNMPSSAMATYASNWGFLKGALQMAGCRVVLVRPQEWIKFLGLGSSKGVGKTVWKNKLKERAQQLYPGMKVTLKNSDALLILEFALRKFHAK
jgi:hypothetical protein